MPVELVTSVILAALSWSCSHCKSSNWSLTIYSCTTAKITEIKSHIKSPAFGQICKSFRSTSCIFSFNPKSYYNLIILCCSCIYSCQFGSCASSTILEISYCCCFIRCTYTFTCSLVVCICRSIDSFEVTRCFSNICRKRAIKFVSKYSCTKALFPSAAPPYVKSSCVR